MRKRALWRAALAVIFILIPVTSIIVAGGQRQSRRAVTVSDCTYLESPAKFRFKSEDGYAERSAMTSKVANHIYALSAAPSTIDANLMPRKNFIDSSIFDRMAAAHIPSAPLATDAEFLRRTMLDLTGRIPTPDDFNIFLADSDPSKRDRLVDSLIGTPEFVDKWTMFFGDLFKNTSVSTNVTRYVQGRDAFYLYIKDAVATNKPYDVMAREIITATGDSFETGQANWVIGGLIPGGPAQDNYDGQAAHFASTFLGVNAIDCLLCHDGARHLDSVNLWGSKQTRMNMWGLAAYFARVQMTTQTVSTNPTAIKRIVSDLATGDYRLNTTTGNRSARQPVNGIALVNPRNPFMMSMGAMPANGGVGANESRRQALARQTIPNIQFSRAIVNYIWEKFMVEGFVSPANSFDPARLDPNNPPPNAWSLQPTNPELLNQMAVWFRDNGYDIRALISLIAKSNAYALSSTYPGAWKVDYVPYYARKYVRRLDAEEVNDAVQKATGIGTAFTFDYLPAVTWAMQLPEPREPLRGNAATGQFLNSFGRGDRDTSFRRNDGSLLQSLNMMNSAVVMSRIHQNNTGSTVSAILSATSDPSALISALFQYTLSRNPTPDEMTLLLNTYRGQTVRAATESLQWVLLNKLDFLFNY